MTANRPRVCGAGTGPCGRTDHVGLYPCGWRCPDHTPAALAGKPEPGQGAACAPLRCYCGTCPSWTPDTPHTASGDWARIDARHVRDGKRRSSVAEQAAARLHATATKDQP